VKPARTIALPVEAPVHVRAASPSRVPPKTTIHIRFLTRPFTLVQLKDLLSKHGDLDDDPQKFWINKVKSHCFATFRDASSAESARKELHGSKWPSSNPKILVVDYADLSEIGKEEEREAAKLSGVPLDVQRRQAEKEARQKAQLAAEKAREEDHARKVAERKAARAEAREKSGIKRPEAPTREWDKHKIRQSASPPLAETEPRQRRVSEREGRAGPRSRSKERRKTTDSAPDIVEEKPVSLDDLFRKTKAEPPIYWLPLTDERIEKMKVTKEEERRVRREKIAAEHEAQKAKKAAEQAEKQARADARRKEIEERRKKETKERDRRRSRSRSPRRRSRSPVRRRRRSARSSSSSSSSSSRSRSPKARGSPSPKRPARGSPSPKRPARGSPSPKRPASGDAKAAEHKAKSKSKSRSKSKSGSPAAKKRAAKSSSGSPPRKKSRSRSGSQSSSSSKSGSGSGSGSDSN